MPRRPAHPTYAELLARAALEAEVARLRAELAIARGEDEPPPATGGTGVTAAAPADSRKRPPGWVKANVVVLARHRPRKQRTPVPGRRREAPDRIVVHAPTQCPDCGQGLAGGRLVGCRQVLDLPPARVEVVEHQVRERRCRRCGWVGRGAMPDLGTEAGGHRRFGWGVAAWVATLRTKLRLPLTQVQWLLERVWGLHVSVGALSGLLDEVARAGRGAYDALLAEARASPVVHLDETGWRENGQNGDVGCPLGHGQHADGAALPLHQESGRGGGGAVARRGRHRRGRQRLLRRVRPPDPHPAAVLGAPAARRPCPRR